MERFQNTRQPDWDWWARLWPTPAATLRDLGLEPGTSVVEVGSGDGYFALPAARIVEPAPVYALDLDESLLADLERIAERAEIETVEPIHGDARDLENHVPEPVDVVLIANTLHGVDEPDELLENAAGVLRPDGRIAIVNWRPLPREETTILGEPRGPPEELRTSPEETERLVRDAVDVETLEVVELPPYHYAVLADR